MQQPNNLLIGNPELHRTAALKRELPVEADLLAQLGYTAALEPDPTPTSEPDPTPTSEPDPTPTSEPDPTPTSEPDPTPTARP